MPEPSRTLWWAFFLGCSVSSFWAGVGVGSLVVSFGCEDQEIELAWRTVRLRHCEDREADCDSDLRLARSYIARLREAAADVLGSVRPEHSGVCPSPYP